MNLTKQSDQRYFDVADWALALIHHDDGELRCDGAAGRVASMYRYDFKVAGFG